MTRINLEKQNPNDWSGIQVSFQLGQFRTFFRRQILAVSYSGEYGVGCEGNGDARYMYAMGKMGIELFTPDAVIIDFQNLEYLWGDMLGMVFGLGGLNYHPFNIPRAMVVGEKCKKAIGTLLFGLESNEPASNEDWIFESMEEAINYVAGLVEDEDKKRKPKPKRTIDF
ncbi:MAG: hypothetical protein DWQ02_10125 [Bacteroidetes bacterium]|nr:MAG: hypothetical protein DWQ02_10125 [Bacteroidota bacterium]